jgi:hypothetical protein
MTVASRFKVSQSLIDAVNAVRDKQELTESPAGTGPSGAMPAMNSNNPIQNTGRANAAAYDQAQDMSQDPDNPNDDLDPNDQLANDVAIAELTLVADRSQKMLNLAQSGTIQIDTYMQAAITQVTNEIVTLYNEMLEDAGVREDDDEDEKEGNDNPNQKNAPPPKPQSSNDEIKTNPVMKESVESLFGLLNLLSEEELELYLTEVRGRPKKNYPTHPKTGKTLYPTPHNMKKWGHLFKEKEEKKKEVVAKREAGEKVGHAEAGEEKEHIVMQLRKSIDTGGKKHVEFDDGEKHQVHASLANRAVNKYMNMKPAEREEAQKHMAKSHAHLKAFAEGIETGSKQELVERVIAKTTHVITQLAQASKNPEGKEVRFDNGQKVVVPPHIAEKVAAKYKNLSAYQKQQLRHFVGKSFANLIKAAK